MSLINFGSQNHRIFKNIHWIGNFESITGLYQMISRCKYKPDFFDYKLMVPSIEEVSSYKSHSYSYSDLLDIRILDALNLAKNQNKKIMIMYSGGLDSTAICVSALKNLNRQDRELVTIVCTPQSYFEFPEFFPILSKNFKIKYCINSLEKYVEDNILITGMQNDLLFGSNGWIEKLLGIDEKMVYENFYTGIPKLFEYLFPNYGKKVFDLYQPIVDESLFEIKTSSEFIYWFYFTQSYQMVYYAHTRYTGAFSKKETFDQLYNFYDCSLFEFWSLNNLGLTIPYSHEQFKLPVKDYICEYLKEDNYRNKRKFPSFGEVMQGNRFNYGLTENWEFLDFEESLKYLKKL